MKDEELKQIFNSKRQKRDSKSDKIIAGFEKVSFDEFTDWYYASNFEKGCFYCGTDNQRTLELYEQQRNGTRPDATRGGKRGRRLELDRKDPVLHYDRLDNVVWCCYWCNNAKSNFFTEEEFKPIAVAIGIALKNIK